MQGRAGGPLDEMTEWRAWRTIARTEKDPSERMNDTGGCPAWSRGQARVWVCVMRRIRATAASEGSQQFKRTVDLCPAQVTSLITSARSRKRTLLNTPEPPAGDRGTCRCGGHLTPERKDSPRTPLCTFRQVSGFEQGRPRRTSGHTPAATGIAGKTTENETPGTSGGHPG